MTSICFSIGGGSSVSFDIAMLLALCGDEGDFTLTNDGVYSARFDVNGEDMSRLLQ